MLKLTDDDKRKWLDALDIYPKGKGFLAEMNTYQEIGSKTLLF